MKYIFLIVISFSFYSCGSKCVKSWTFQVPFNLENEQDTYKVNDTIWISSYLDHKLTDALTGEKSEYPDFGKHEMMVGIAELDGTGVRYAHEKIVLIPIKGNYFFQTFSGDIIIGNPGLYTINYENNPPNYEAKFGIVLKESGIFIIQVGNLSWTINEDTVEISECKDYLAGFEVKFTNDSDFNFELYDSFPKPDIYPEDKFEYVNSGLFTFTVEE